MSEGIVYRLICIFWNVWYGVRAPIDGTARGAAFGHHYCPKLGTMINMLTSYIVPAFFLGLGAIIGGGLGTVSGVGCFLEAIWQIFSPDPYQMPVSRALVDWMPPL